MNLERIQLWQRRHAYLKKIYEPLHARITWDLLFCLKLRHYLRDKGNTEDRTLVQFKGRQLYSKVRRIVADVCNAPLYIEASPKQGSTNSIEVEILRRKAELTKFALEDEVRDVQSGFDSAFERAVLCAVAARMGVIMVNWEPEVRPYGRTLFDFEDPRKVMLAPPHQDWFSPVLPYLIHECEDDIEVLRAKNWDNVKKAVPDGSEGEQSGGSSLDEGGRATFNSGAEPTMEGQVQGKIKYLKCWSINDKSTKKLKREDMARVLEEEERYHACIECGYKSDPMPGLAVVGDLCPDCLMNGITSQLIRVDREMPEEELLAFKEGRRLEIVPVSQPLSFYDGSWPQGMRAYPYCIIKRYEHPTEPAGLSETALDANVQVVSNATYQRMLDQSLAAPNILIVGGGKLKGASGSPFVLTDAPWQIAYKDDPFVGQAVQQFQAQPHSAALGQLAQLLENAFRADLGTVEFGVGSAQDIKSITAQTAQTIEAQGSIPTVHFLKRIRQNLSVLMGVTSDIQREAWTEARWIETLGSDGKQAYELIRGSDLTLCKIRISAEPELKMLDAEKFQVLTQWFQMPPQLRRAAAKLLNIPPSLIQEVEQAEQEFMDQQAEMARMQGAVPNGQPVQNGAGNGVAPAPMELMAQGVY